VGLFLEDIELELIAGKFGFHIIVSGTDVL
jgi:hypothetical protein